MNLRITILTPIPLIREGLRALLADETDFEILPLAPRANWMDELSAQAPHVLLMDVQVPEREGWQVLEELNDLRPALTILLLGDRVPDTRVARAFEMGARGYLLRETQAHALASAIRAAHSGSAVVSPELLVSLSQPAPNPTQNNEDADEGGGELIEALSARELDVLRLLARGLANKQIAAELFITEHTVKFHIRAILGKLGAANRTEAVTQALQRGLVTL